MADGVVDVFTQALAVTLVGIAVAGGKDVAHGQ